MSRYVGVLITLAMVVFLVLSFSAARAQGIDGVTSAGCVSVAQVLNPEVRSKAEEQGGRIIELKGEQAAIFLEAVEALVGSPAPFKVDLVLIGIPELDAEVANIAYFKDDCLKNTGHLPTMFVEQFEKRV